MVTHIGISDTRLGSMLWASTPVKQKKEMLKSLGLHPSWSKARDYAELRARGGGFVIRYYEKLISTYKKRKPNQKMVRFK